jgi:hypothetical protein
MGQPVALRDTEVYDPTNGTWLLTGSLTTGRYSHTATLLADGRVLVAAGNANGQLLNTAELYDPASGIWRLTDSLPTPLQGHTATRLPDNRILVAGGGWWGSSADAHLYDPASDTWLPTEAMSTGHTAHSATLLQSGQVLVAGGLAPVVPNTCCDTTPTASAELYTPGIIFPSTNPLDNFNRPNGRLGTNWSGSAGLDYYKIVNNRVNVRLGGPIYWTPTSFGVNQEAFVTVNTVNPSGFEHGLVLKVQRGPNAINYQRGAINVDYRAQNNAVLVSTLRPNRSWKEYPELSSITFNNGDKLGARVFGAGPNAGMVHIYKNGAEIGVVALDAADQTFFNHRGGNIGLWFGDAYGAVFDDFGGGNV